MNRLGRWWRRRRSAAPSATDLVSADLAVPYGDRLLIALITLGSALAASVLVASWQRYGSRCWLVLAGWALMTATGVIATRRTTRAGGMAPSIFTALTAVVLAVDLVVAWALPPQDRLTAAAWNWGFGAVVICVLAVSRSARDVVLVACAHAWTAAGIALASGVRNPTALVVITMTCLVPPLSAAQYLTVYSQELASRQAAVELRTRSLALRAEEQAQRQSVLDQVASIRSRLVEVLEDVAAGADVSSDAVRHQARVLSTALRRALDTSRTQGWLPGPTGHGDGDASPVVPPIDVLGSPHLLDDEGRARVAALVHLLVRHPFDQIVVTVSAPPDGDGTYGEVTVVARGPGSAPACGNAAVAAAVTDLNATLWHDTDADSLVVEARVRVASTASRGWL